MGTNTLMTRSSASSPTHRITRACSATLPLGHMYGTSRHTFLLKPCHADPEITSTWPCLWCFWWTERRTNIQRHLGVIEPSNKRTEKDSDENFSDCFVLTSTVSASDACSVSFPSAFCFVCLLEYLFAIVWLRIKKLGSQRYNLNALFHWRV